MVLADDPSQFQVNPLQPKAAMLDLDAKAKVLEAITAWNVVEEIRPDKYVLRDFNFKGSQEAPPGHGGEGTGAWKSTIFLVSTRLRFAVTPG